MKASGIDIIAYQDSLGAGFQPGKFQFLSFAGNWLAIISQYVAPLYSLYHFNEVSRTNRLNYLRHVIFPGMPYIHDRTGVEFWINTELWRMDGHCMGQTGVYGCNYPGIDFSNQLKIWSDYTPTLMLNEGFTQFSLKNGIPELSNTGIQTGKPARENAAEFTRAYRSYLGL